MRTACFIYSCLAVLDGTLAWMLGGDAFLLTALTAGLVAHSALRTATARPVAEGMRFAVAALIVLGGPWRYQAQLVPLLLCLIALPHFLAATQAATESSQEGEPHAGQRRMRSVVFSIAFYTSMGLVFLLGRGTGPELPDPAGGILAVAVLLAALAAWEGSRITRLRRALPSRVPPLAVWAGPAAALALLALLYTGPLPMAAAWLTRLSPGWRMDPVEFRNRPPKPPPTEKAARAADGPAEPEAATDLGLEESAAQAGHRLPKRSDWQPAETARLFVRISDPARAAELLREGPVYIRSHTLNRFEGDRWTPEVTGGVWVEDAGDGASDGVVTLAPAPPRGSIAHEVFMVSAAGYSLPAIAGLTAIRLPRVYSVPGEILQASVSGDIRYQAESSPRHWRQLPDPGSLEAAPGQGNANLNRPGAGLGLQLKRLADNLFAQAPGLADRIAAVQAFLGGHYEYSTVMRNPGNLGPLENFLFDERRGHCDFFASAAALLLREGGVPTRTAYGYASPEFDPATGVLTVRARHAHAWTEIEVKGHGWVICDFTPERNIGQPAGPPPTPPAPPDLNTDAFQDAARQQPPPPPVASRQELPFFSRLMSWLKNQPWAPPVLHYAPFVLLAGMLMLAVIRWWRKRRPDAETLAAEFRAGLERQPEYFLEFLRISREAGHPRPDGCTPLAHYRALQEAGLPVPSLWPMIRYHCATRYEDQPRDPDTEHSFTVPLREFALAAAPAREEGGEASRDS